MTSNPVCFTLVVSYSWLSVAYLVVPEKCPNTITELSHSSFNKTSNPFTKANFIVGKNWNKARKILNKITQIASKSCHLSDNSQSDYRADQSNSSSYLTLNSQPKILRSFDLGQAPFPTPHLSANTDFYFINVVIQDFLKTYYIFIL